MQRNFEASFLLPQKSTEVYLSFLSQQGIHTPPFLKVANATRPFLNDIGLASLIPTCALSHYHNPSLQFPVSLAFMYACKNKMFKIVNKILCRKCDRSLCVPA
jgi:hypothetical protein